MEKYSIAIAREYGSGGRLIGKQLARELGIGFYDKELIGLAAKESGLSEDCIQIIEKKETPRFFYNLLYSSGQETPLPEMVFLAQSKIIQELTQKESCVIIGRCAGYVLREQKNCIRIFIHAPLDWRVKIVKEEYHENHEKLENHIRKLDKSRADYYNFFTDQKWGQAQNYNICLDSSMGIETSVQVLKKMILELTGGNV